MVLNMAYHFPNIQLLTLLSLKAQGSNNNNNNLLIRAGKADIIWGTQRARKKEIYTNNKQKAKTQGKRQ
jgi:hypothetical protein